MLCKVPGLRGRLTRERRRSALPYFFCHSKVNHSDEELFGYDQVGRFYISVNPAGGVDVGEDQGKLNHN